MITFTHMKKKMFFPDRSRLPSFPEFAVYSRTVYRALQTQHRKVGHIPVAYFFFSLHQYLFLFLFYRIVVSWLSYRVSVWSLGQHVCRFSARLSPTCRASDASETYKIILFPWRYIVPFDCKQQISTKH